MEERTTKRRVGERKRAEEALREARAYAESIVQTVREPLVVLDADLRVISANRSFYQTFQVSSEETANQILYDLGDRQWDIPSLRHLLEEILPQNTCFQDFRVDHKFEHIGRKTMLLNARRIYREHNRTQMILLAIEDITERKRAEDELHRRAAELEVANRELEAANRELAAFSYSVSHDLRAPLRGVDGFSQMLLDDYGDQLDAQGKDYLRRVRAGIQRIGQLIDDLLTLSRVTRGEMRRETVDLSALARAVAEELREQDPARKAEFAIADGLVAKGDPELLQTVLENLLGNAWKFTSTHPEAEIEFGALPQQQGQPAYFVRDDGVGFDMAYADKLFGLFQRLHAMDEFSGSGVGLASVLRIIHRHGGRVWAEGAVGQGATFYFTL
jgi:PAS domain S-box-containing protein